MNTQISPQVSALRIAIRGVQRKNWPAVRKATGVGVGTLRNIAYGTTVNPRLDTVEALQQYFGLAK